MIVTSSQHERWVLGLLFEFYLCFERWSRFTALAVLEFTEIGAWQVLGLKATVQNV